MKKLVQKPTLLALILILATVAIAKAGTYRSPSKDTMCDAAAGSWCANGYGVQSASSGIGACIPDQVGFIGWDLTDVSETIGSAQLTLTTYDVTGVPVSGAIVFQLFEPSTQLWTESDVQPSPGGSGTTLATTTAAITNGTTPQTVVFGGSANPSDAATLGAYFEAQKTSGSTTIGIRIDGGCSLATLVAFNDREDSGNLPGGAAATEPDLLLFTPTAVSLTSLNASSANSNSNVTTFLTIGALGIVAIVTSVVGLPLLRKRKRQA